MEPVAIIKVSYLNVSPAALVSVFEARSAFTISVLRIKEIPDKGMGINTHKTKFNYRFTSLKRTMRKY